MPRDGAAGGGQAQHPDNFPRESEGDEGGDVGAEVHHLGVARGGDQIEPAQGGESQDNKRPRSGAEEAVIGPQRQADDPGEDGELSGRQRLHLALQAKVSVEEEKNRDDGQQGDQHVVQGLFAQKEVEPGAQGRADEGGHRRHRRRPAVELPLLQKPQGGHGGAEDRRALVCGRGEVGRQSRH